MTTPSTPFRSLIFLALGIISVSGASNPGPPAGAHAIPSPSLSGVHRLALEISWDFGDLGADWRKEIVGEDRASRFFVRWKHSGPSFASASLAIYDQLDSHWSSWPLPVSTDPDEAGWRTESFTLSQMPTSPPLTLRVRLEGAQGNQIGSASPEVQISPFSPDDPFLYTPLFMNGIVTDTGVPGLAAGVTCPVGDFNNERRFHAGVREFDGGAGAVGPNDLWHWGSNTKAMTATLLALLIQNGTPLHGGGGVLSWDTRLAAVWPEWSAQMESRFVDTTLRHLATMRSGIFVNEGELNATKTGGDPREIRRLITHSMLTRQHLHPKTGLVIPPGTEHHYRNENYFILGAAIEQMADGCYEDLMQSMLLLPLGITSAGFGVPVDQGPYQPHGHWRSTTYPYGLNVLDKQLHPPQAPAGALYSTVEDWLKFCRLHLTGREGSVTLSPATLSQLHTPYPKQYADDANYAMGWAVGTDSSGGTFLDHNGSIGTYYSRCILYLDAGIAVAGAANCGGWDKGLEDTTQSYGNHAVTFFLRHLVDKARSKEFGGDFLAGSLFLNEQSEGLSTYLQLPAWAVPDDAPGTVPQLGEGFFPVSLYLSDVQNQRRAAAARAPRITEFRQRDRGGFSLCFQSKPGFIYQLYRLQDLQSERRELVSEFTATDEVTEVEIEPTAGELSEFFQVSDLEE